MNRDQGFGIQEWRKNGKREKEKWERRRKKTKKKNGRTEPKKVTIKEKETKKRRDLSVKKV